MLTYYETTSGRRALKGWSHFPTNYTEQFVYSTEQAAEISKTTKETVLSMPSVAAPVKASETADRVAPAAPAPNQPAVAVTEAAQPSVAPTVAAPPARSDPGGPAGGHKERDMRVLQANARPAEAANEVTQVVPVEFPKTAGDLPIIIWLGVTTLGALLLFKMYRRDPAAEMQNARNNAVARRVAAGAYRNCKLARSSAAEKQA
jgi:hypothetical protein